MDMFLIFNPFQISPKSILYTLWGLRGYNAGHRSDVYFKSHSHEIVTRKVQFLINIFLCYFCKGFEFPKKLSSLSVKCT